MTYRICFVFVLVSLVLVAVTAASAQGVPKVLDYQGRLTNSSGVPVPDGSYQVQFRLFSVETGGTPLWIESKIVQVAGGLFTTTLGSDVPLEASSFGGSLYLEIVVEGTTLSPREQIVSSPFAIRAGTVDDGSVTDAKVADVSWGKLTGVPAGFADGVDNDTIYSAGIGLSLAGTVFSLDPAYTNGLYWSLGGNTGTTPGANFLGTTDNTALEIKVNGQRALRIEPAADLSANPSPNIICGSPANTLASGVYGATISGGGMSGYTNRVTDIWGTVGGGWSNRAGDDTGTVFSAVQATVSGGTENTASGTSSTVGGGQMNTASGYGAAVGGGVANDATADESTVAGGWGNAAGGARSSVAGGRENVASGGSSAVGGGSWNQASGAAATVAGGSQNTAGANYSTVGGGQVNTAGGQYATVPGGYANSAQGDYSFAAGRQASASHAGTFVWADSNAGSVASTAAYQFLIYASGGVGIGANDPQTALDVNGIIRSRSGGFRFPDGTVQTTAATSGLTLPYSGTTSSASDAFSVTNTGDGRAGYLEVINSGTINPALTVRNNGWGPAIYARHTGGDNAGTFIVDNPSQNGAAVSASINGGGVAVDAYANGTSGSAGYFRNTGPTNSSPVLQASTNGNGNVVSASTVGNGHAVYGFCSSTWATGAAVRGETASTQANVSAIVGRITSTSPGGYSAGVRGINEGTGGSGIGIYGSQNGSGWGVYGTTVSGSGVRGYASGNGNAIDGYVAGTGWAGVFSGGASGNGVSINTAAGKTGLTVSGGTKNAVVATSTGARLLYTEESTEVWFTDYGFGKLKDGRATIAIDPMFAETVSLDEPYHVFVQLRDAGCEGVAVVSQTAASFDVVELRRGRSNAEFSYRIVARRRGYENARLEQAPQPGHDPNFTKNIADKL